MKRVAISVITVLLVTNVTSEQAYGADQTKIRAANIGIQAVTTLVSGAIQGKVRSGRDVVRCLLSGSASGYGFYEAKVLVADRHVQTGWLVSNVAASMSENAAAGRNPFAQLGYSLGPFRIRISIPPLDRDADAYAYVDVSEYETLSLIRAYRDNDKMRFRKGLIMFERHSVYPDNDDDGFEAIGRTYGMFPGLSPAADDTTWPHEVIHAIQALQGDAVEPALSFLSYKPTKQSNQPRRIIRFEHLKVGMINIVSDQIVGRQPYHERWYEIEAFRLTEDIAPPKF